MCCSSAKNIWIDSRAPILMDQQTSRSRWFLQRVAYEIVERNWRNTKWVGFVSIGLLTRNRTELITTCLQQTGAMNDGERIHKVSIILRWSQDFGSKKNGCGKSHHPILLRCCVN